MDILLVIAQALLAVVVFALPLKQRGYQENQTTTYPSISNP